MMGYKEIYNLMSPEKDHCFMQVLCVMYFPKKDRAFVIDVDNENTFFIDNCTDKIRTGLLVEVNRTGLLVEVNRLALLKIGTAALKRELKAEGKDDRRGIH